MEIFSFNYSPTHGSAAEETNYVKGLQNASEIIFKWMLQRSLRLQPK